MNGASLIDGPVPVVLLVVGGVALFCLLARGGRGAAVSVVVAAALGALTFLGLDWLVTRALGLLPEPLPVIVRVWIAVGVATVVLVVGSLVGTPLARKVIALVCGVLVLLTAGSQINMYFEQYPTLGALVGDEEASVFPGAAPGLVSAPERTPVVSRWTGPPTGVSRVDTAPIPGTISGFTGRDAYVYLPPAYTGRKPPRLPVLILVAGQPGGPEDWVVSGMLQSLLDGFAAAHAGLAPITVVVDPNGSDGGNTMCMDSDIARADTYLGQDVPAWIKANLGVDTDHARWAFGGWSYGGTCSIQMATRHPDLYPSFIDIAGEREPAISADRTQTIQQAFGGDTARFDALTPLTIMAAQRFPTVWGYFAAGSEETQIQQWNTEVMAAAQSSGMTIRSQIVPNQGHSWGVPTAALVPALDWLAPRMGLSR
ncbi:MAG: esterase family protein [Pseudonocardia sp.]|nr:esterase family protein [Pseudonocardia sp.]